MAEQVESICIPFTHTYCDRICCLGLNCTEIGRPLQDVGVKRVLVHFGTNSFPKS